MLDATRCPECGWSRPSAGEIGTAVWQPRSISEMLGGPGGGVFAAPAVCQGVAVFPLPGGELIGLDIHTGDTLWQIPLPSGQMTRRLLADGSRILACFSDERPLEEAGNGCLVAIESRSGELTTLWETQAHQFSAPVITHDHILLHTANLGLVALNRATKPSLLWNKRLNTWWALPPFIANAPSYSTGIVIVADGRPLHGEAWLAAFNIEDGSLIWQKPSQELIAHSISQSGHILVHRDGQKQLVARDVHDGQVLWSQMYARLYSVPLAYQGKIFQVVRGEAPSGKIGHYLLLALDPLSGDIRWKIPLAARARIPLAYHSGTLLMACDDGWLRAYACNDGHPLWEYQLGGEEDPIRTEILVADDFALIGSYSGRVAAIRVASGEIKTPEPQEALAEGDIQGAADGFALQGNWKQAAQLYADSLHDLPKAFALLEYGKLYRDAGDLARAHDKNTEALTFYQKAGEISTQADLLLEMDDKLGAAVCYESAGELSKAAPLFEEGGDLKKAMHLYESLNDVPGVVRLFIKVIVAPGDVDFLESHGQYKEAGQAALQSGLLERAAKLFNRAGDHLAEMDVLLRIGQETGARWALENLSVLARSLGKFLVEAEAEERMGREEEAAQAYYRAARQAENSSPMDEDTIASFYKKAGALFDATGILDLMQICYDKAVYFGHLPDIVVKGIPRENFKEQEWNILDLVVKNMGRGTAHQLQVTLAGSEFEAHSKGGDWKKKALAPGQESKFELHIRPLSRALGNKVPLVIEWQWQDRDNHVYCRDTTTNVTVQRHDEVSSNSTPQEIHYHGPVYQAQGNVEFTEGDRLGDGAQKGDKVVVKHGNKASKPNKNCPVCNLPIEKGAKFCEACGTKL